MTRWLLDTNIVSELRRPKPNQHLLAWMHGTQVNQHYLCSVTVAEIRVGIELLQNIEDRIQLSQWLEKTIRPLFADRIVSVGEGELVYWRLLGQRLAKQRSHVAEPDLLIAAIAGHNKMTIVTRNHKDFIKSVVPILNPFTGERFNGA
ncbi:MAG: type II toxin-antitoxin system VapC family toxin [Alphaproteobacteria bacterium]|nr:type II toxin-antitoxin system VapC family toxin [Alphaproteobacteria bacterium]